MTLATSTTIVTGAGSGIGRATALELGRHGAAVVCAGRRAAPLDETVAAITAGGGRGLAVPTDITVQAQAEALAQRALDAYGRIDALFNNAGSFAALGAVWEVDPAVWWQDVEVNLRGTMLCCRAVLPAMLAADSGVLINMSGGNQIPGGTGYSCGKVAVDRFTALVAKELTHEGSAVICCGMGPGFVHTAMTEPQISTELGRKWLPSSGRRIADGTHRPPEDCARAVAALLQHAGPALHGGFYGPDTDFAALGA